MCGLLAAAFSSAAIAIFLFYISRCDDIKNTADEDRLVNWTLWTMACSCMLLVATGLVKVVWVGL